jgi:hypothetical protein
MLTRVADRAKRASAQRREAALAAGASDAPAYARAVQSEREAADLERQGLTPAAVRRLWDAEEDFAAALEWKADTLVPPAAGGGIREAPETEAALRAPLQAVARAYAALSGAAVKAAVPSLSADEARALDRSFLDYRADRREIRITRATFRSGRATVECTLDRTVTLRTGEQRQAASSTTFVLESANGQWVVRSASRLPN